MLVSTQIQREAIVRYVAELIGNRNAITVLHAVSECMLKLEFDLQQLPHINEWRTENSDKTFEDYYDALEAKCAAISRLNETIPKEMNTDY